MWGVNPGSPRVYGMRPAMWAQAISSVLLGGQRIISTLPAQEIFVAAAF
jgi:hypothetical protein